MSGASRNTQLALQKIKQIRETTNAELAKKYRTRARQTPSMLHSIGLLGTLSYLFAAAGKQEYDAIYLKHIMEYLGTSIGFLATTTSTKTTTTSRLPREDYDDIIRIINSLANDAKLLAYSEAVLEPYLIELKTFAEALLESE